jgi:AcrR family transcriptional regulator
MSRRENDDVATEPNLAAGRRPAQKRSQARVTALLDAADHLLVERDLADIGLYDVANLAKVPPTSAYHFFPTKESVFLALAERYLQKMHAKLEEPIDPSLIEQWPELIAARYQRVVDYFNDNLPARKLFMGTAIGSDVKKLDFDDMKTLSEWMYHSLNVYFEMPYLREPAFKFTVLFGIYDGIWATSYARHGHITREYAREGLRAGLAYLSTFLPQTIALRPPGAQPPARIPDREIAGSAVARR